MLRRTRRSHVGVSPSNNGSLSPVRPRLDTHSQPRPASWTCLNAAVPGKRVCQQCLSDAVRSGRTEEASLIYGLDRFCFSRRQRSRCHFTKVSGDILPSFCRKETVQRPSPSHRFEVSQIASSSKVTSKWNPCSPFYLPFSQKTG